MTSSPQQQLMEQLVQLTDAVKALAERPTVIHRQDEPVSDADRVRQRVTFGYQALGTLTGRVSSATGREFDVPVVAAARRRGWLLFDRLPPGVDWVELRSGSKVELLRIRRLDGRDDADHDPTPVPADLRHTGHDRGIARPSLFQETDPIGSMVFLRTRSGALVAFGPRLPAAAADTGYLDAPRLDESQVRDGDTGTDTALSD